MEGEVDQLAEGSSSIASYFVMSHSISPVRCYRDAQAQDGIDQANELELAREELQDQAGKAEFAERGS